MDQWLGIGIFLLGAASGALLSRIALIGLKMRQNNAMQSARELVHFVACVRKDDHRPMGQTSE